MLQTASHQVLDYENCGSAKPSLWLHSPSCSAHPQGGGHRALGRAGSREGQLQQENQGEPSLAPPEKAGSNSRVSSSHRFCTGISAHPALTIPAWRGHRTPSLPPWSPPAEPPSSPGSSAAQGPAPQTSWHLQSSNSCS